MKWTAAAEAAVKKVPFFVRKRVRARVEQEARQAGKHLVDLVDVRATQKRYLANMASEVKGYQLETCFGPNGCPHRANPSDRLARRIEAVLQGADLLSFLRTRVKGDLKFHHEFRVTLADCPNACSQPQIKDIGIIGACSPILTEQPCTLCGACMDECREGAIELQGTGPEIEAGDCLHCGKCAAVCDSATIGVGQKGFRVQLGGKLGRHPQLARELPGIFSEDEVVAVVQWCLDFYMQHSRSGERFAELFTVSAYAQLTRAMGRSTL